MPSKNSFINIFFGKIVVIQKNEITQWVRKKETHMQQCIAPETNCGSCSMPSSHRFIAIFVLPWKMLHSPSWLLSDLSDFLKTAHCHWKRNPWWCIAKKAVAAHEFLLWVTCAAPVDCYHFFIFSSCTLPLEKKRKNTHGSASPQRGSSSQGWFWIFYFEPGMQPQLIVIIFLFKLHIAIGKEKKNHLVVHCCIAKRWQQPRMIWIFTLSQLIIIDFLFFSNCTLPS